ncbi:MAG: DUF11 domain-containing protein [Ardenticatenaceae bacterium]|nr:DUF11 domain-containing protein [Ardenticatenaceae bacterium]
MQYKRFAPILTAFLLVAIIISSWQRQGYAQPQTKTAQPLSTATQPLLSSADGLTFSFTTADFSIAQNGVVTIAGLETHLQEPGAPALPAYSTYIALPPAAVVASVQVDETVISTSKVDTVQPAPRFDFAYDDLADDVPFAEMAASATQQLSTPIYEQDTAVYNTNSDYPTAPYTISEPMYYRDWRLVRLTLYPVRYNPVSKTLTQVHEMQVALQFSGGDMAKIRPLTTPDPIAQTAFADAILNYEQGQQWRHLPDDVLNAPETILPIGQQTFKIEIDTTGIYEISGADLQAHGMNIANVNPTTIQMTYRGEPVAYQLIHNGDNDFDLTDKIRFYGWTFNGSRLEKQFIGDNNVFWLWANGTATTITTETNGTGQGYPVTTTFPESITLDTPERYHFHTRTSLWDNYPNEPDAWYIDYLIKGAPVTLARTYAITLPNPALSGPDVQLLAEITIRDTPVINSIQQNHVARLAINSSAFGERQWENVDRNNNITTTVPITSLVDGMNTFRYTSVTTTTASAPERIFLNRVTVDYQRQLTAVDNQLAFQMDSGTEQEFHVANFSENNVSNILVWDISQPNLPVQINMTGNISQTGTLSYTYKIGRTYSDYVRIIATTTSNTLTPAAISAYTPPNLNPTNGAEWLAITHADFTSEANRLAAHRSAATFSDLSTQVVNIKDVINQYGYGLPIPGAIHDYLTYALGHWAVAPRYVTIFGDSTFNPLHNECAGGCLAQFDINAPIFVISDLVFKDNYQGLVPSDHTMVLLSGDDLIPDMAIGRIAAETITETVAVVDKIILYETQQLSPTTHDYHDNVLFVADMTDEAGNFCIENEVIGQLLPPSFNQEHLCLADRTEELVGVLANDMQSAINFDGVGLLNYRGHGSVDNWIRGSFHPVTSTSTDFWFNTNKPTVILSADCLDGYFTYPGLTGLGESFLKLHDPIFDNIGTVAHWSSTGLGTTTEHTALLRAFYTGLFQNELTAIGDAAVYAKTLFWQAGFYPDAEMYSFTLQGDPAMQLYRPDLSLEKASVTGSSEPGETAVFSLTVSNSGLYPAHATITDTLPTALSFVSASGNISFTYAVTDTQVVINFVEPLAEGESATVTLRTQVAADSQPGTLTNRATVASPGLDFNLANNTDTAQLAIFTVTYRTYLPLLRR